MGLSYLLFSFIQCFIRDNLYNIHVMPKRLQRGFWHLEKCLNWKKIQSCCYRYEALVKPYRRTKRRIRKNYQQVEGKKKIRSQNLLKVELVTWKLSKLEQSFDR